MTIQQLFIITLILFTALAFIIDIGLDKAILGFNSKQEQTLFTITIMVIGILLIISIVALCNSIINL